MKRIVFLICALLLVFDLANDGCIGKAPPPSPRCADKFFLTLSPESSTNTESPLCIPPAGFPDILRSWHTPSLLAEIENPPGKIDYYLLASSGGIPL
jgi:hypothetical protein